MSTTKTTRAEYNAGLVKRLVKMGYKKAWLEMMQDPQYSDVRWTLDELIQLEALKGEDVIVKTQYKNIHTVKAYHVNTLSVSVLGASLICDECAVSNITKKSLASYLRDGVLDRDMRMFTYDAKTKTVR